MTPLTSQRAVWTALIAVMFSWLGPDITFGQDQPQVAESDQPATTQPAPTTHPATQAARDRLTKYRNMKDAAAKNGRPAEGEPPKKQ